MFKFVEKTKIWFTISLIVIAIGIVSLGVKGLNFGIDFKGGTLIQIDMKQEFDKNEVTKMIKKYADDIQTNKAYADKSVQLEVRSNSITNDNVSKLFKEVKSKYKKAELKAQDTIGASIGSELKHKAFIAAVIATIAMLIYIGVRFEFKFGLAAIIALVHDILITLSVYTLLQIPVNSPFIAAMLTILGYSINDTIVVFDRIRENQKKMRGKNINEITNSSISQTLTRSINTVITTLFTIIAVNILVPSVREFTIPLIIGVISGCYSSIFIASPTWVLLKKKTKKATV
ncbi:protein translocase subunit SecF [Haloimpatiens sp. FM7330]|uniref:protein translocase subunit SecF n=1 Tax=Haloimpatiens sp. FM7330 TaxID=3298610 RepID=UPI003627C051